MISNSTDQQVVQSSCMKYADCKLKKNKLKLKVHKISLKCIIVKKKHKQNKKDCNKITVVRVALRRKQRSAMVSVSTLWKPRVCEDEQPRRCIHFPLWLHSRRRFTACLM